MSAGAISSDRFSTPLWPTEIRLKAGGTELAVAYEDGSSVSLSAEYLRIESPSAEVQGHSLSQKILVSGCADVLIVAVEPVGNYAVRLRFNDGHDTGIYTWRYFKELAAQHAERWPKYVAALAAAGLRRK